MKRFATLVIIILVDKLEVFAGNIPPYLTVCHRDIPDLSKCLINAAHSAKPYIGKGIKEMGIPPLSPFALDHVSFEQGIQAVSYRINLTNIKVYGMDDYVFSNLSFDPTRLSLQGTVLFDKIDATANYAVKGNILVAPISGVGTVSVNAGTTRANFDITGKLGQNKKHIIPTKVKVEIIVNNGEAHFKGFINDNEELSQATNRILNENSKELLKDSIPALEQISGEVLSQIWGTINKIISYDQLLPPSP